MAIPGVKGFLGSGGRGRALACKHLSQLGKHRMDRRQLPQRADVGA
jgi:hypothetical protein